MKIELTILTMLIFASALKAEELKPFQISDLKGMQIRFPPGIYLKSNGVFEDGKTKLEDGRKRYEIKFSTTYRVELADPTRTTLCGVASTKKISGEAKDYIQAYEAMKPKVARLKQDKELGLKWTVVDSKKFLSATFIELESEGKLVTIACRNSKGAEDRADHDRVKDILEVFAKHNVSLLKNGKKFDPNFVSAMAVDKVKPPKGAAKK